MTLLGVPQAGQVSFAIGTSAAAENPNKMEKSLGMFHLRRRSFLFVPFS
jgi:hypothetical protein